MTMMIHELNCLPQRESVEETVQGNLAKTAAQEKSILTFLC